MTTFPRLADARPGRDEPPVELVVLTAEELLRRDFPPAEAIFEPWLRTKNLAMIFAPRGVGKTWLSLSIAGAIASGMTVFTEADGRPAWRATEPRHVLLVDGEMPAALLQRRFGQLVVGSGFETADRLVFLAADVQEQPLPNLAERAGQEDVEKLLKPDSVLILDSISTLVRGLAENEADGWEPVQEWLLSLRRRGVTVIVVHHAGRNGNPRGTSKREDVLDVVIALENPEDYDAEDGARFTVIFKKARSIFGHDVESFEAELRVEDEAATWRTRRPAEDQTKRMVELQRSGLSLRKIAEEVGVDHSTVSRQLAKERKKEARRLAGRGKPS